MRNKLPCGCAHDDLYWLVRCGAHTAEDAVVSARWAHERANPPEILVHRINGVIQAEADIYQAVAIKILQESVCLPVPTPQPTNGSETSITSATTEQIDYSALLNQF